MVVDISDTDGDDVEDTPKASATKTVDKDHEVRLLRLHTCA